MLSSNSSTQIGTYYLRNIWRIASGFDWWLLGATAFLLAVGLITLKGTSQGNLFFVRQLEFICAGAIAMLIFWRVPYLFWTGKRVVPIAYGINLGLLLAVMLRGHTALGAQRWLSLGPVTIQPSEIAKLVVIFTLAAWFHTRPVKSFFDTFKALAIMLPPAILVFKQPDLGTSLTFGAIFFAMYFWAGATIMDVLVIVSPLISLVTNALSYHLWLAFLIGLAIVLLLCWRRNRWSLLIRISCCLMVILGNYACGHARPHLWGMLKEYQQKRLTSFVNPYQDPRGSGYHILQSLIAIGSGGVNGFGLGKGNQSQGAFIPERHTDFIFAVIGEELGFKVAFLVVLAYTIICSRGLIIAFHSRGDPAGALIAIGVMSMFLFHAFLNIGMTMGIMPVAGVPLPFVSYGGTALIVDLVAIGLLLSIRSLNPPPAKGAWQ